MKVLIFGATGFIGKNLVNYLLNKKYAITVISRNKLKAQKVLPENVNSLYWDYSNIENLANIIEQNNVIINLAGENISSKRWSEKRKKQIINSRVKLNESISKALNIAGKQPDQIIQASAIGYYGYHTTNPCNEFTPKGDGFLAEVCEAWEQSLQLASDSTKKTIIRIGIVLGNEGGILPQLIKPIRLYLGSNFGKGTNYISWIHIKDLVRAIDFLIDKRLEGSFNLTSPTPIFSKDLNFEIGKILKRPILFRIPRFVLEIFMGEMAKELIFSNQQVYPENLKKQGFQFKFEKINIALKDIIKKGR